MDDTFLTTRDNPYNPFTEYVAWYGWDIVHHHPNTSGWLAKLAHTSPDLSDSVNENVIAQAMQTIVDTDPDTYRIVTPKDYVLKED